MSKESRKVTKRKNTNKINEIIFQKVLNAMEKNNSGNGCRIPRVLILNRVVRKLFTEKVIFE